MRRTTLALSALAALSLAGPAAAQVSPGAPTNGTTESIPVPPPGATGLDRSGPAPLDDPARPSTNPALAPPGAGPAGTGAPPGTGGTAGGPAAIPGR